ncbi:hypothetical protein [Streptomyces sp. NPDC046909]|uniref:hypothetical protein n=1 Tax=Streptomyces sp. NPDC046909 TaxID=3155617 RepID=UPI003411C9D9
MSVTLLSGCGGSGDSGSDAVDDSASASAGQTSAAASAVKPLSAAELDKASLVKADLTGYEVSTLSKADTDAIDAVKVGGEECRPLGRTIAGGAVGEPAAASHRRVTGNGDSSAEALDINTAVVTLASYASADEAAAALKSIGEAITACAGGFEWTVADEQLDATKVTKTAAPEAGEEAVAFTVLASGAPWKAVVLRDGATLAHFTVANTNAVVSGKDFAFPADLVTAQADKLG